MKRRLIGAAYYAGQALTVACLLLVVLQLWKKDVDVPFGIEGDSLFWTVIVEAVYEDGWGSQVTRLGAPFGSDIADWPMGMPLDFGVMSLLRSVSGTAGAALNLYWLLSMVTTGVIATLCLRWLGFVPPLAFALGALYALLPYGFGHNTGHIPLVFHFIPLIAFLALRLAEGDPRELTRGQRFIALGACLLQGMSYIYYGFFSTIIIVAAFAVGWARARRPRMIRTAALALGLLLAGTLVGLAPSLSYWYAHGRNPELAYKSVSEADTYGLRIRHMLTPIPDHPIAAFRRIADQVRDARFPGGGENVWARLGTVGSVGFFILLGACVAAAAGVRQPAPILGSAAALTLVALLVAQVGGFGSLFNVFVTPDIRAYSRIVVFIAFFSLVAAGLAISEGLRWLSSRGTRGAGTLALGASALLLAFAFDQASTTHLVSQYEANAVRFEADRRFVARVESLLPRGAMVYQLRHTDVPVERVRPPMELYDHGWAFLHSKTLRWSWGGVRGRRQGDWPREVSFLPPADLVRRVALAGFAGIWVDRFGYEDRAVSLIPRLAAAAGEKPLDSQDGRFVLVSLVRLQQSLEAELDAAALAGARENARAVPLVPRWGSGCDQQEAEGGGRFCGPTARLFLRNTLPTERRVVLHALLEGPAGALVTISVAGETDTIALTEGGTMWQRSLTVPGRQRLRIDLASETAGLPGPRFRVLDLRVSGET